MKGRPNKKHYAIQSDKGISWMDWLDIGNSDSFMSLSSRLSTRVSIYLSSKSIIDYIAK